jgi:hypothetical protein
VMPSHRTTRPFAPIFFEPFVAARRRRPLDPVLLVAMVASLAAYRTGVLKSPQARS